MLMLDNKRLSLSKLEKPIGLIVLLAVLLFVLGGCAALQNQQAMDTERLLSAAGFQMKLADTPEKMAHLKTLTQRKLVPHERDDKIYYVYADANECQCIYVGTEKAYQRYQKLALKKQIAEERLNAAEMNENAAMDWGMWGPWGPWW
ncbi:MAG: hypothetical protein WCA08_10245 [Desulfoferrobacter sp.]